MLDPKDAGLDRMSGDEPPMRRQQGRNRAGVGTGGPGREGDDLLRDGIGDVRRSGRIHPTRSTSGAWDSATQGSCPARTAAGTSSWVLPIL